MRLKKVTAAISAAVVSASMFTALPMAQSSAEVDVNYAEALQKSLFFYEVQQSGTLPDVFLRGAAERQKAGLERSQLAFGLHDQRLCDRRLV